jgi:hypothetical protein
MGEKIEEGVVLTVGDDVWGCCLQGLMFGVAVLSIFPNMESEAVPNEK